jgi:hypothetical protein
MTALATARSMKDFDPTKRARLHEQLNDRIDVWEPIPLKEWRRRMRWHDSAETVVDWGGHLYDGWGPRRT